MPAKAKCSRDEHFSYARPFDAFAIHWDCPLPREAIQVNPYTNSLWGATMGLRHCSVHPSEKGLDRTQPVDAPLDQATKPAGNQGN